MLWIEKYKPKKFNEMRSHKDLVDLLRRYNLETIPNVVFYGGMGHGKSTIVECLMEHLYGCPLNLEKKHVNIQMNAVNLIVEYLESNEVVEITPSDYGTKDRIVTQHIVKTIAENRPILGMFGMKKRKIKTIVIKGGDNLTRDAQAALRRTMEMYTDHLRIILICSEISRLLEPIKSRCLLIRVRGISIEEFTEISKYILASEKKTNVIEITEDREKQIIYDVGLIYRGNCLRGLCILEFLVYNGQSEDSKSKKLKIDMKDFRLDWEEKIFEICHIIKSNPDPIRFKDIREILYWLLGSQVPGEMIILLIVNNILEGNSYIGNTIVNMGLKYSQRLCKGSKEIYHLEAFAVNIIFLLSNGLSK